MKKTPKWVKAPCFVCGGKFVLPDGERPTKDNYRCHQCGDSPFSAEQYTAHKYKTKGKN